MARDGNHDAYRKLQSEETMSLRERIGIDVGNRFSIQNAVEWAAANDVYHLDVKLWQRISDGISADEAEQIRETCSNNGIQLGLHTDSAVNMAENRPFVDDATDEYLFAYIDAAENLGAKTIVVHGGYHFTSDVEDRFQASLARIEDAVEYAEGKDVELLMENHNPEPDAAEVHYIPTTPEECDRYFSTFSPQELGWAFNPAHANLYEGGIEGFVSEIELNRAGEIRLNDNRGIKEEHLPPGEGTMDFTRLFELVEAEYDGRYIIAYGTPDEMLNGREYFIDKATGE